MLSRALALTVALASLVNTAAAQMSLVSQERTIEVRAFAQGGGFEQNVDSVVAPDAGVFNENRMVTATTPLANAQASAQIDSLLAPDRIVGSGFAGAFANSWSPLDPFVSGSGNAVSRTRVVFDVSQACSFTMVGSRTASGDVGSPFLYLLRTGGPVVFDLYQPMLGTVAFDLQGTLTPGRYALGLIANGLAEHSFWSDEYSNTSYQADFRVEPLSTPFCFGDGTGAACPCGNSSAVGGEAGCLNSLGQGGALRATGVPSLANDTLVLQGTQMTNASALYFQGTTRSNGGDGAVFGDGKRCAGGSIARLGTKTNAAGASQYPEGADQSVSLRGAVAAPGTRTYQVWYRNVASFCTADGFNLTNGVAVEWQP